MRKMTSPTTTTPTAVNVPATADVLWRKPDEAPAEGTEVSAAAPSVLVASGVKSVASKVVGAAKSVGATSVVG